MGELAEKPEEFREGQRLGAEDLNKILRAIPRSISGAGIDIKRYGDRIVVENNPINAGQIPVVQTFIVVKEYDDVLQCVQWDYAQTIVQYDPSAGGEAAGDLDSIITYVAKPNWLQRSPWDGQTVLGTTYTYTDTGERLADTDTETIDPPYFPGAILSAYTGSTGLNSQVIDGNDSDVTWTDLNEAGRSWLLTPATDGTGTGDWSTTVDGTLNTTAQTGAGDKTTQDGSWIASDGETGNTALISAKVQVPNLTLATFFGNGDPDSSSELTIGSWLVSNTFSSTRVVLGGYEFGLATNDKDSSGNFIKPAYTISGESQDPGANFMAIGQWGVGGGGDNVSGGIITVLGGLSTSKASTATVWCNNTVSGSTNTLQASNNVLSVTRNSAGNYTINFAVTYTSGNAFTWAGSAVSDTLQEVSRTSSSIIVKTASGSDATEWGIAIFGGISLASGGGPSGTSSIALTVNANLAYRAINAPNLVITGIGFSTTAASNILMFSTLGAVGLTHTGPTTTQLQVDFPPTGSTIAPTTTGVLMLILTVSGVSTTSTPVATIVPAPVLTTTTNMIGPGAQVITIIVAGLDPTPGNNIWTSTSLGNPIGTIISVTPGAGLTAGTAQLSIAAPTGTGTLSGFVNSFGGNSNTTTVATVAGSVLGPNVTPNTANLTSGLIIQGNYFDPVANNNTVAFSPAGSGTVTSSTITSLTVSTSGLTVGPLMVVVTTNTLTSGAATQVATVIAGPVVTLNTSPIPSNAGFLTIRGSGFGSDSTVALNSGTAVVFSVTPNTILISLTNVSTTNLTANVTSNGLSSGFVQVATLVIITVTPSTASIPANAASVVISGTNFSPNAASNRITIAGSGSNFSTWAAIDGTSLVETFFSSVPLRLGPMYAIVEANGGSSLTYQQIATVVTRSVPTIIQNLTSIAYNAGTITIIGTNFDPTLGNNLWTFNNGVTVSSVTSITTTTAVLAITNATSNGSLTLNVVTQFGGSSGAPIQVATITGAGTTYTGTTFSGINGINLAGSGPYPGVTIGNLVTGPGLAGGTTVTSITGNAIGTSNTPTGTNINASYVFF